MKDLVFSVAGKNVSTYTFSVEPRLPPVLIDLFTRWIDRVVQENLIHDGQELQYGWTVIQCVLTDSVLQFRAPDGRSFPIQYCKDLTPALESIVFHDHIPRSFDLQADIPALTDTVLVGDRFHEIPMFLTRSEKSGEEDQHCGWFMASLSDDSEISGEENLRIMSLYEAVLQAPHILKYISMPAGTQVVFEQTAPQFYHNSKPIEPCNNGSRLTELAALGN
jgi:hypothetical protein